MKKTLVFSIIFLTFSGLCFAQNNEQRIIGTWVSQDGTVWVFNANGILTIGVIDYKFAVTDTHFAYYRDGYMPNGYVAIYVNSFSISSDGRILLIVESGREEGLWLTKR